MGYEVSRKPDMVSLDVVAKPFRPHAYAVGQISATHLSIVNPTSKTKRTYLETARNEAGYATNLIARLLYGCGLRVSEPLNLRVKEVHLSRCRLWIRGAKGGNDRVVPLPVCLVPELAQQLQAARGVWERDKQDRMPVMLPHRLAKKYPECRFNWGWARRRLRAVGGLPSGG
jgi:integrase